MEVLAKTKEIKVKDRRYDVYDNLNIVVEKITKLTLDLHEVYDNIETNSDFFKEVQARCAYTYILDIAELICHIMNKKLWNYYKSEKLLQQDRTQFYFDVQKRLSNRDEGTLLLSNDDIRITLKRIDCDLFYINEQLEKRSRKRLYQGKSKLK